MFSVEFQKKLEAANNTKWASKLSESELETMLWLVGEFGHGGCNIIEVIEKHVKEIAQPRPACERAFTALKALQKIVSGTRTDIGKIKHQIEETPCYSV